MRESWRLCEELERKRESNWRLKYPSKKKTLAGPRTSYRKRMECVG